MEKIWEEIRVNQHLIVLGQFQFLSTSWKSILPKFS